jgi:hypothetical protein
LGVTSASLRVRLRVIRQCRTICYAHGCGNFGFCSIRR